MDGSKYAILGDEILRYAYGHCDVTADWDKGKDQLVNFCYRLALTDSYRDVCGIACYVLLFA
jgi:hypothetical protein